MTGILRTDSMEKTERKKKKNRKYVLQDKKEHRLCVMQVMKFGPRVTVKKKPIPDEPRTNSGKIKDNNMKDKGERGGRMTVPKGLRSIVENQKIKNCQKHSSRRQKKCLPADQKEENKSEAD